MPPQCGYGNSNLNPDSGEDMAIFALRLSLGGAPGPYEWGVLSESICDFSIAIMQDAGLDPTSLCAPNGHLVPPPLFLYDSIPFPERISDRSKSLIRYNFVTGVSFFQILVCICG